MAEDIFSPHYWESATGILWAETKHVAKLCRMHRTFPPHRMIWLVQNINSIETEKLL